MARTQPTPDPDTAPDPTPAPAPVWTDDTGLVIPRFTPIEVPAVDHTVGFTPIAVTPIDQAIQAATTQES